MRPHTSRTLSPHQVQAVAKEWLSGVLSVKDRATKCTRDVLLGVLLKAAAHTSSISAACRDLAHAPSDQAVRTALLGGLPRRRADLDRRLDAALAPPLPRALRRRALDVACDFHLIPYHGRHHRHKNELYHCKAKCGTTKSHAYATACVVHQGLRYTLAVTPVKGREPIREVLTRLLDRVQARGVRVRALLLDRQFCTKEVVALLQARRQPFLMPAQINGRAPTDPARVPGGLRRFLTKPPGRYRFAWPGAHGPLRLTVVVAHQDYRHHKDRRRHRRVLVYVAWRVGGDPETIRQRYRRRFGIESSYRQLGQARARTSTRAPRLRLLLVVVGLVLRNVWVWLHWSMLADRGGGSVEVRLGRLRFRRLLDWIAAAVVDELHDGTPFRVEVPS
jgi:hypothetical protein